MKIGTWAPADLFTIGADPVYAGVWWRYDVVSDSCVPCDTRGTPIVIDAPVTIIHERLALWIYLHLLMSGGSMLPANQCIIRKVNDDR